MKKLLKFLFMICIILGLGVGIVYAVTPKEEGEGFLDVIKKPFLSLFNKDGIFDVNNLSNDEMFDKQSKARISINEVNFNSLFTDRTITCDDEIIKLYQDAYRSLAVFETNLPKKELNMYVNVKNDLGKSMYIYVTVYLDYVIPSDYNPDFIPEPKIWAIDLKWYNQDLIARYERGTVTYGTKSQGLIGSSFTTTDKSKVAIPFLGTEVDSNGSMTEQSSKLYDCEYIYHMNDTKADDVFVYNTDDPANPVFEGYSVKKYTKGDVHKVCDSLYTDLFQIDIAKDETHDAIGEVKTVSLNGLKAIADGTYSYDKEQYGESPLYDIWNLYERDYREFFGEYPTDSLLFAVDFYNEKTLKKKTFYLNVSAEALRNSSGKVISDANGKVELYEYVNGQYQLIGIVSGYYGSWISSTEYDFTDFREWSLEATYMYSDYTLNLKRTNPDYASAVATFEDMMRIEENDFPSEIFQNVFKNKGE